jgi:hypothetical protein
MANVKISDLTQATGLQTTDLLLISQDDGIGGYDTKSIEASLLEGSGRKMFIAKVKQLLTAPPTITIIKDSFNGTYTTSYLSTGEFEIVGFDTDLSTDCEITLNTVVLNPLYKVQLTATSADTITIKTYDASNTLANSILNGDDIFIKVTKYA